MSCDRYPLELLGSCIQGLRSEHSIGDVLGALCNRSYFHLTSPVCSHIYRKWDRLNEDLGPFFFWGVQLRIPLIKVIFSHLITGHQVQAVLHFLPTGDSFSEQLTIFIIIPIHCMLFHHFDNYVAARMLFSYSLLHLKGKWQLLKQKAVVSDFLVSYLW